MSDATVVALANAEYRDDALYVNGRHAQNGGGRETTVRLATDIMDLRQFTVALRLKASDFDAGHDTLLSTEEPRFLRLFRSPQGNLGVSLGQIEYSQEFDGAKIAAEHWTTVACGVDLEAGKCIVYVDGDKAGESDIPQASQPRNLDVARPRWTFGDYSRGPVYHGLVDEFIVYDKLLSPGELAKVPLRVDSTSAAVSRHPRKVAEEAVAQAAASVAAVKNAGVPARLIAHFLFNGDAKEEVQQNSFSTLQNVRFRDGALYLSGTMPPHPDIDAAGLTATAPLDTSHFTAAVRFKADDFGDHHQFILGYNWDSWFALNRLPSGNLGFHLAGGAFYRELATARLEAGKWTVVAFGVDLNIGKAIVYFNGGRAGEFEVPTTLERRAISDPAKRLQFWTFRRLDHAGSPMSDPVGPPISDVRVMRGGHLGGGAFRLHCRSAFRRSYPPHYRFYDLGFRVIHVLAGGDPAGGK